MAHMKHFSVNTIEIRDINMTNRIIEKITSNFSVVHVTAMMGTTDIALQAAQFTGVHAPLALHLGHKLILLELCAKRAARHKHCHKHMYQNSNNVCWSFTLHIK